MTSRLVEIEYCRQCRWLLRAAWMAQELLATFEEDVLGVTLKPGTGGVFDIRIGAETIWSRASDGGFPEIAELKRRVRDKVAPDRSLGHIDRSAQEPASER
jgi:selenoprotein W-related protein